VVLTTIILFKERRRRVGVPGRAGSAYLGGMLGYYQISI
jgi:hypothetical protein